MERNKLEKARQARMEKAEEQKRKRQETVANLAESRKAVAAKRKQIEEQQNIFPAIPPIELTPQKQGQTSQIEQQQQDETPKTKKIRTIEGQLIETSHHLTTTQRRLFEERMARRREDMTKEQKERIEERRQKWAEAKMTLRRKKKKPKYTIKNKSRWTLQRAVNKALSSMEKYDFTSKQIITTSQAKRLKMVRLQAQLTPVDTYIALRRLTYEDQRRLRSTLQKIDAPIFSSERKVRQFLSENTAPAGEITTEMMELRKDGQTEMVPVTQAKNPAEVNFIFIKYFTTINCTAHLCIDCATGLKLLNRVHEFFAPKFLSDEGRLEQLAIHLQQHFPRMRVGQKGHILFRHCLDFAQHWRTIGYFNEQAIESYHAEYNRMARRMKTRDKTVKQEWMMKKNWNLCFGSTLA